MFIVTNTIQVTTAHADKMIERFRSTHTNERMTGVTGFLNFEVMHRTLPENSEVTELVVLSRWESQQDQENWTASNSFKDLHKGKKAEQPKTTKEASPVLGNTIAKYHLA
ncbi:antibiotic biosynthesis monooxygenase [Enterococcus sp. BWR-S5]|uniref:antibiotic biosynthesis monooxygenase n=1 Tax=Enterococcus sp. BWR-S5 TaxID=2787714 RepID=UPI00192431D4|nr:antibiotic biosynthesis monooxygenase [Enterococcus sp. BWR-S5]MBL1226084.1 antibiotic biosynthesis monooxygenase [Enterococcus sp. BWR-S5]